MPDFKYKREDLHIFAQMNVGEIRLQHNWHLPELESNLHLQILVEDVHFLIPIYAHESFSHILLEAYDSHFVELGFQ